MQISFGGGGNSKIDAPSPGFKSNPNILIVLRKYFVLFYHNFSATHIEVTDETTNVLQLDVWHLGIS